MKTKLLFSAALCAGASVMAQHATFEAPVLAAESAWYGQDQVTDGDTLFNSGSFNFETNYNAGWGSWAGWSVSNVTNNTTPGWGNQYSAITGGGQSASDQYSICYAISWESCRVFNTMAGAEIISGMYVTNSTYAYYAMQDGDLFTKPFGADTNAQGAIDGTNGEDWFLLTIYALGADSLYTGDSINFYLADYRFAADADDYIVDQWTYVDLTGLGPVKGLDFVLTSSDTSGGFGMNNPSYFAVDNLEGAFAGVQYQDRLEPAGYPNPTTGAFYLPVTAETQMRLFDMNGNLICEALASDELFMLDLTGLDNGMYLLTTVSEGIVRNQRVIKQ